ncbi:MAG: PIN domain-containing protein, partial [Clostridiales Family XIII bacterium]|nr:PIN domain-containing protein [Clostridiales Family XIII bacterium]
ISSITLAELEFGVSNSKSHERNRNALLAFSTLVEILPFDIQASAEYGEIRAALEKKGMPIGALDTLIAAHAKSRGLTLVTNNTREFRRVEGLFLEDWMC